MMQANRAAILYDNLILTSSLSATSQVLSVDYLKSFQLGDIWRSSSAVNQTIIASWSDPQTIKAVGIAGHIFTGNATVRLRISDNADLSSPVYDATFYAVPSVIGNDEEGNDEFGLDGVISQSLYNAEYSKSYFILDLIHKGTLAAATASTATLTASVQRPNEATEDPAAFEKMYLDAVMTITSGTGAGQQRRIYGYDPATRIATLDSDWSTTPDSSSGFSIDFTRATSTSVNDETYSGKYLGITIQDGGNAAGYVQAGWLYAGTYRQMTHDIQPPEEEYIDHSEQLTSESRHRFIISRRQVRMLHVQWAFLTETEARRWVPILRGVAGAKRPVLFLPHCEISERGQQSAVYGLMGQTFRVAQVRRNFRAASFMAELTVEEL